MPRAPRPGEPITAAFLADLDRRASRVKGGPGSPLQIGPSGQVAVPASVPDLLVEATEDFGEGDPSSGPVKLVLFDGSGYSTTGEDFTVYVHGGKPKSGDRIQARWNANSGRYEGGGTTSSSTVTFPGLTNSECQCGRTVRGREVTDCPVCSCVNPLRRTSLPTVTSVDDDAWPEVQTIAELTYEGNCEHKSRKINGISCFIGEGEEAEEVSDEYQFSVNFETGIAELKCVTEVPQCPVIYIRWVFCPDCAKQCTSTWRLKLDIYENCFVENCEICITPVKDRTQTEIPCNVCEAEGFVLPGEVQLRIFDHPVPSTKRCGTEIDPEDPEGPGIPGHTISATYDQCHFNGKHLLKSPTNKESIWVAADYGADVRWIQPIELDILDFLETETGELVMCQTVWSKQYIRNVCGYEPPCPTDGFIPNAIVHQEWAWLQQTTGSSGLWKIKAYLRAGESSSEECAFFRSSYYESAEAFTCEELAALRDFDPETEDAPEVELLFVSGSDPIGDIEPLPSLWFSFQIPEDDPAPSSGHFGASCGPPEEEPCTKPCKLWVQLQTIDDIPTKVWKIKRNKGCGSAHCHSAGMAYFVCQPVTTHDTLGPASAHDVGYEASVTCVAGALVPENCESVPASLNVTCGESTGTLSPPASNTIGVTCNGETVSIELTYSCENNCPTLTYDVAPGCPGTAVLDAVVSLSPLDITFSIPAGVCCSEGFSIHITE